MCKFALRGGLAKSYIHRILIMYNTVSSGFEPHAPLKLLKPPLNSIFCPKPPINYKFDMFSSNGMPIMTIGGKLAPGNVANLLSLFKMSP